MVSVADIERGYQKHPSLAEYLPWRDVDEQNKVFLLEDNKSLAVGFEITPLPCEARPAVMMEKISQAFKESLQNAIPQEKNHPWILQIICDAQWHTVAVTYKKFGHPLTRNGIPNRWCRRIWKRCAFIWNMSAVPAVFLWIVQVTQQVFRGGFWQVYAFLYRRETDRKIKNAYRQSYAEKNHALHQQRWEDIKKISAKLSDQWRACGLGVKRSASR